MIIEHKICPRCKSKNRVKNGTTASGKQKIYGLDCKAYRLLDSSPYTEEKKEEILKTYQERASLRAGKEYMVLLRKQLSTGLKKINWRIFLQMKS